MLTPSPSRPPAPRSLRRAVLLGSAALCAAAALPAAGCSHDWDIYDPRLGGAGGGTTGAAAGGTSTSTTSPSGGSGGDTTSTGGSGGDTTSTGGTGGTTSTGGTGGTTSTGGMGGTGGSTSSTGGSTSTGGTGGSTSSTASTGGSTGTGGTGGGGPVRCGGTGVLADDYDMGDPGEVWDWSDWGAATIGQSGGELVVTFPAGSPSSSGAYQYTRRLYDLRGDAVSVEVTNAGDPATTTLADFGVGLDDSNYLEIYQHSGTIYFTVEVGGVYMELKTLLYSDVMHRYWRFRDDGVDMRWETSADGAAWATQAQMPVASLFPLDFVGVSLGGETNGGEAAPGEVRFDRLNGGGAPAQKWCPAATLVDDFEDGVEGPLWARSWSDAPGLLTETGGELVLGLLPDDTAYAIRRSSAAFDLTGSEILFEVPLAPDPTSKSDAGLVLSAPGGGEIAIIKGESQLHFSFDVAGVTTQVGSVLYAPLQHRWWRVREAGGTLFWETAPDGKTWTAHAQYSPLPIAIDALDVELGGGTWAAQPSPGAAHFDNLNLPPP